MKCAHAHAYVKGSDALKYQLTPPALLTLQATLYTRALHPFAGFRSCGGSALPGLSGVQVFGEYSSSYSIRQSPRPH